MTEEKQMVDIRDIKLSIIDRVDSLKADIIGLINVVIELQKKLDTACQEPKPVE